MPSQRQKGTKLAGAYITDDKDDALAALAAKKGFANKAEFIRALYDAALEEDTATQRPTSKKRGAKSD